MTASIDDLKTVLARKSETAGRSLAHLLALTALGQGMDRDRLDGACRGMRLAFTLWS
jgi:hypothetical protein